MSIVEQLAQCLRTLTAAMPRESIMKIKISNISIALLVMAQANLALGQGTGAIPLFQIPPTPVQPHQAPKFELETPIPSPAPSVVDTTTIRVNNIKITGQYLYEESELIAISGFTPGSDMTLTELRAMTGRITNHFRKNGYFLAQAYLPTQDIKEGVVTVAVVVGQYGEVSINNQTNLSNSLANNLMSGIESGNAIESGPLETRLLLLSDLAGVKVSSTLAPGAKPGSSDLKVDLTPGARVTGSIDADNAGLPYTGVYRLGGTINVNNLAGLGDIASLRVLSSGNGMTYGRASYQFQVGRLTLGAAYTQIGYSLGKEFTDLGAHGTAKIVSVFASYPLVRTRDANLYATLGYDMRAYQDKVDLTDLRTDKRANVLMPGIYGDFRDKLGGGGLTGQRLLKRIHPVDQTELKRLRSRENNRSSFFDRLDTVRRHDSTSPAQDHFPIDPIHLLVMNQEFDLKISKSEPCDCSPISEYSAQALNWRLV